MKKGLSVLLVLGLVTALALPLTALAKGPDKGGDGRPAKAAGKSSEAGKTDKIDRPAKAAEKAADREAREEFVAERKAQGQARKDEAMARKAERKAAREASESVSASVVSEEETGALDPDDLDDVEAPEEEADESGEPKGRGIETAFARITANLEKSLARIADGKGNQVPPGLQRVWLKFASWLGAHPSTMPGADVGSPEAPTSPPEPTSTVEPTMTVEPSATVDPADPVDSE